MSVSVFSSLPHANREDMILSRIKDMVHWAPSVSRPNAAHNALLIWKQNNHVHFQTMLLLISPVISYLSSMLSDELQRFLNEINSEHNKVIVITFITSDDITFVIFTVCENRFFMNSGFKVLPKGLWCSILSKIMARMLMFRDRTTDVTYCANVMLFLHAKSGRKSLTAAFSLHWFLAYAVWPHFLGKKPHFYPILCCLNMLNKTKLTRNG